MARPINYATPPVQDLGAQRQAEDFVQALHESGLLRALTGAVRAYPDLLELVVRRLDADTLRSLYALAGALGKLDPDQTERVINAGEQALGAADHTLEARQAPSVLDLLRSLGDADVRRGAGAVLAGLGAFGRAMKR